VGYFSEGASLRDGFCGGGRGMFLGSHPWKCCGQSHPLDSKILLKDDISGGLNVEPKFACNGLIYSWTDALAFKKHMSGDDFRKAEVKNPNRKTELEKLATSVKEDDNHLIIVITLKK
jgi:hypothetical protein